MSNNYDKDIITDTGFRLRRIWGKNRPHPIAEKFVVHYLHVTVKTLWLVVPVVAFLYFYYFTVNHTYPVAIPIIKAFIVGGGFFLLSIILHFPLFRLFGYRVVSAKELQLDRRNSYVRSLSGHEATRFLQDEYLTMLQGGTPITDMDMDTRRRDILQRLNAAERATFLRNEALAAEEGVGANRKKMRDFNKGVAAGYVAGRQQSRYF